MPPSFLRKGGGIYSTYFNGIIAGIIAHSINSVIIFPR
jgi:hypothetical protein